MLLLLLMRKKVLRISECDSVMKAVTGIWEMVDLFFHIFPFSLTFKMINRSQFLTAFSHLWFNLKVKVTNGHMVNIIVMKRNFLRNDFGHF